jgi:hypothetical protein
VTCAENDSLSTISWLLSVLSKRPGAMSLPTVLLPPLASYQKNKIARRAI